MTSDRVSAALLASADETLVARCVAGDTAAFAVLVRRHSPLLRVLITRIVGSATEADDVVQDSFVIAWREMANLRDGSAVRAWLLRICTRQAYALLRKRPADLELAVSEAAPATAGQPETQAVRNAQLRALALALDQLPTDQRQAWLLREAGGLDYAEIGELMEIPASAVRGKLARARANIVIRMEAWR